MKRRLLFVSKGAESASTRYRALQYFPLWQAAGFDPRHVTASGGARAIVAMLTQAAKSDVVIVLRKTLPWPLLQLLRHSSRRLVFDFDDAIFCNTDGSPSATRMSRFVAMMRVCDHVFAGNGFLADNARRINPNVTLVPTCIDPERYQAIPVRADGHLDLVWIGSSSTRKYLEDALPWLAQASSGVAGLRLKIIADFDLRFPGLTTLPIAWSAAGEANELASSDIGIAPMRDDEWSRGKCALKILQYMAAGLPVISSDVGANREVVSNGKTGFLAASPQEWSERIATLAHDPALRHDLGSTGRQQVQDGYSIAAGFSRQRVVVEALL